MKKLIFIVFLVIPLLFFTYACGEETQANVAEMEVTKVVEKTQIVAEPVKVKQVTEEKPAIEIEAKKVIEEKPVITSEKVTAEEEILVKPVVMAASHEEGAKLFKQNCASCHAGGGNLVNAQKTLKKEALEKYDMYSKDAIVYQVTNGKNAMPAFGKRLSSEQIEQLSEYVLAQANRGW